MRIVRVANYVAPHSGGCARRCANSVPVTTPPPSRMAEILWMATKGTTWLARRSRDLVPALLAMAVREWLTAEDEVTERELVPVSEHPST